MARWISFAIFISVVITVYSLLNYYFIHKHKNLLTIKTTPVLLLRLVLVTIILTPIATMFFSRYGLPSIAAITGFAGYSWLAFLGLFLGVHGLFDILLIIAVLLGMRPSEGHTRVISTVAVAVSISVLIYGSFEAKNIQITTIEITTNKLKSNEHFRIMHISDVHFSPLIGTAMAEKIRNIAVEKKPDLLVSTGDLLDPGIKDRDTIISILQSIQPSLGKIAVMGNHEFYSTVEYSEKFINEAGFLLLRNESKQVNSSLVIAGIDDPAIRRVADVSPPPIHSFLSRKTIDKYTILLKHQPRIEENSEQYFDLQLSGHTHGGQIYPFKYFVQLLFRYMHGRYDLEQNSVLYVSRGVGTWGPPFRFLAQPEVVIFDLIGAK